MAFSEILKIKPQLDSGSLSNMESTLNKRFSNVAKRFGGGLKNAILGGGITAIALGVIDKVLNPINEVKDNIQKTLENADQLATNAKQFGTSTGNLFRLQQFAQAKGLDQGDLFQLLTKFQGAVAQSRLNPNDPSAVRQFSDNKDTAEAFFQFIQSLQKLDATSKVLVQQDVFGEKAILKMSSFLEANFKELDHKVAGIPGGGSEIIDKTANLSDSQNEKRASLAAFQLFNTAKGINQKTIDTLAAEEARQAQKDLQRLSNFQNLEKIQVTVDKMNNLIEQGFTKLAPILADTIPKLFKELTGVLSAISKTRGLRDFFGGSKDN